MNISQGHTPTHVKLKHQHIRKHAKQDWAVMTVPPKIGHDRTRKSVIPSHSRLARHIQSDKLDLHSKLIHCVIRCGILIHPL